MKGRMFMIHYFFGDICFSTISDHICSEKLTKALDSVVNLERNDRLDDHVSSFLHKFSRFVQPVISGSRYTDDRIYFFKEINIFYFGTELVRIFLAPKVSKQVESF